MISPWLLRQAQDAQLKFTEPGMDVYLRIKNDTESGEEYLEYGFQLSATGLADQPGFRDIKIVPPASVVPVSLRDIGLNQSSLSFGAHRFRISHTFVMSQMMQKGYSDPYEVFTNAEVIGLYFNQRLFSIDSLLPDTVGNEILAWDIVGNMHKTPTVTP